MISNKFYTLGIEESMLRSIEEEEFDRPTEIQEKSIPFIVDGKDVIGGAATGSGKTLAFATGVLNTEDRKGIKSLILVPTRELAIQVAEELEKYSKYRKQNILAVFGGVSIDRQIHKLKRTDIVVGTPGRILDHIGRRTIDLRNVEVLVLDEADRMLDMGFIEDVEEIINTCPQDRQTLLFSATITEDVEKLSDRYMTNPKQINLKSEIDPTQLRQFYYYVDRNRKFSLLHKILKEELKSKKQIMIFTNTRKMTEILHREFRRRYNLKITGIHGGLSQHKRMEIMGRFNDNKLQVLACTDVAARGLDIKDVSTVINFDIPNTRNDYIHRIGRTARAGQSGKAISFVNNNEKLEFSQLFRKDSDRMTRLEVPRFANNQGKNYRRTPRRENGSYTRTRDRNHSSSKAPSRYGF